jgi:P-type Ca2+ transporter type 2C
MPMPVHHAAGDNKDTADAICNAIGVFSPGEDLSDKSIISHEFAKLPQEDKLRILTTEGSLCFSRAEPRDKQACSPP